MSKELIERLRNGPYTVDRTTGGIFEFSQAADALEQIVAENERLKALLRWAHDTLWEINPSNYDHGDVCKLNDVSVEVILGIAPTIGRTPGKSPEWWAAREALESKP